MDEQPENDGNQHQGNGEIEHQTGVIRMHTFRMQPAVLDLSDVAVLLKARILVVHLLDELTVSADEVNLSDGVLAGTTVVDDIL